MIARLNDRADLGGSSRRARARVSNRDTNVGQRATQRLRVSLESLRFLWIREHNPYRKTVTIMAEGTIKRLTDKGFGFIETGTGTDLFFHMSAVEGVRFEDLRQGQRVSFNVGQGPKGPRAENVKVI